MEVLTLILLLSSISNINCYYLSKEKIQDLDENGTLSGNWTVSMTAGPPYNLTESLERFLGKWVPSEYGSYYFFQYPSPRVSGYVPGVVLSAKQSMDLNASALFEEAADIQFKIEQILQLYQKVISRTSIELMNIQIPRFQYLSFVNESGANDTIMDKYDKEWIFGFAVGAIETETIMRGYRQLLKKFTYLLKKLICARQGVIKYQEGHRFFAMVYAETIFEERSAEDLLNWVTYDGYNSCQFVESSRHALKYELFDVIVSTRSRVLEITGEI